MMIEKILKSKNSFTPLSKTIKFSSLYIALVWRLFVTIL